MPGFGVLLPREPRSPSAPSPLLLPPPNQIPEDEPSSAAPEEAARSSGMKLGKKWRAVISRTMNRKMGRMAVKALAEGKVSGVRAGCPRGAPGGCGAKVPAPQHQARSPQQAEAEEEGSPSPLSPTSSMEEPSHEKVPLSYMELEEDGHPAVSRQLSSGEHGPQPAPSPSPSPSPCPDPVSLSPTQAARRPALAPTTGTA